MKFTTICAIAAMLMASSAAYAACEDYSMSGEATPKFDGSRIVAISATGVSEVRGGNPTAVSNGMKAASLRARGALVRYMSQDVSATELLESYNAFEEVTTNGESVATEADFQRQAEVIQSHAEDILRGATIVAECFDDGRDLAFVTVGVSETIISALGEFGETQPSASANQTPTASETTDGSFERKSPNAGLFQ